MIPLGYQKVIKQATENELLRFNMIVDNFLSRAFSEMCMKIATANTIIHLLASSSQLEIYWIIAKPTVN